MTLNIQLVALDLDGTLVDENLHISPRTIKAIQTVLHETTVRVVIATGRMYQSSLPFVKTLGIQDPIIAYQGAFIRDVQHPLITHHHQMIPENVAGKILTFLMERNCHINLYVTDHGPHHHQDQMFTNALDVYASYYQGISGVEPRMEKDLLKALTGPPTKIMIIEEDEIHLLLSALRERFGHQVSICQSRHNFCEIIHPQASKWDALRILANRWGIAPSHIMAIGDQGNDASMISQSGFGVAMGNAPPEVQAMAKYVTGTIQEDGAAQAIEQWVLRQETPVESPSSEVC